MLVIRIPMPIVDRTVPCVLCMYFVVKVFRVELDRNVNRNHAVLSCLFAHSGRQIAVN